MTKVAIIGAGPAGLFAAHKLKGKADITIFDQGRSIEKRKCQNNSQKNCTKCNPCNITCGVGGAGLHSDGKLIYHKRTGNNLTELIKEEKVEVLLNNVEEIFEKYGVKAEIRNEKAEQDMLTKASQYGIEYIPSKQAHVGSDKLPKIIKKLVSDLEAKIITKEKIIEINPKRKRIFGKKESYAFDYLIIATGRSGGKWLEQISKKLGIKKTYNPVDIGVRIEVPSEIMKKACEISWDFKARMITPTYEDPIRTFCVCPNGFVARENHNDFCLVNGHSKKDEQSQNTNFAFLSHWKPKDPIKSGNTYGEAIAQKASIIWGGKPVIQRLGDLRRGRRSTWKRITKYQKPQPTLIDSTPGDLGSGLEYRFVLNILEGLEKLNKIIPGVAQDSTLLYAPEIKFHGIKIITDQYLQTNISNIYVAGDGAGVSRGIVGAAASGLLAAKGILKNL
tara:strand:- start:157 stop:1500 length:1344 start_codon:yes stop_codon:yes gene_type:complete